MHSHCRPSTIVKHCPDESRIGASDVMEVIAVSLEAYAAFTEVNRGILVEVI